jgi:hypothetical protein
MQKEWNSPGGRLETYGKPFSGKFQPLSPDLKYDPTNPDLEENIPDLKYDPMKIQWDESVRYPQKENVWVTPVRLAPSVEEEIVYRTDGDQITDAEANKRYENYAYTTLGYPAGSLGNTDDFEVLPKDFISSAIPPGTYYGPSAFVSEMSDKDATTMFMQSWVLGPRGMGMEKMKEKLDNFKKKK